jgi:hypothetical protein
MIVHHLSNRRLEELFGTFVRETFSVMLAAVSSANQSADETAMAAN